MMAEFSLEAMQGRSNEVTSLSTERNNCQPETLYPVRIYLKSGGKRDFPGGPVVKILCFHFRGHGFNPWSGN